MLPRRMSGTNSQIQNAEQYDVFSLQDRFEQNMQRPFDFGFDLGCGCDKYPPSFQMG